MKGFFNVLSKLCNIADYYDKGWSYTYKLYFKLERKQRISVEKIKKKTRDQFNNKLEKMIDNPYFLSEHSIQTRYIPHKCCEIIDRFYRFKEYQKGKHL